MKLAFWLAAHRLQNCMFTLIVGTESRLGSGSIYLSLPASAKTAARVSRKPGRAVGGRHLPPMFRVSVRLI